MHSYETRNSCYLVIILFGVGIVFHLAKIVMIH